MKKVWAVLCRFADLEEHWQFFNNLREYRQLCGNWKNIHEFLLIFIFSFSLHWCYDIMFLYNCWGFMFIVELSRWDYASWLPNLVGWHLYKWGLSGCAFNVVLFGRGGAYIIGANSSAKSRLQQKDTDWERDLCTTSSTGRLLPPLSLIIFAALSSRIRKDVVCDICQNNGRWMVDGVWQGREDHIWFLFVGM